VPGLRELAAGGRFYSGPEKIDPGRLYNVAASEMLLPKGHPVGSEVEAIASYLNR